MSPPQIPGMPTPPPHDGGAGPYNSQSRLARLDDIAWAKIALAGQAAADVLGLTHAARGMRHYLGNTGTDYHIDPDKVMQDVPSVKDHAEYYLIEAIEQLKENNPNLGSPITFEVPWKGYAITKDHSHDWFLAMAAVEVCSTGIVTFTEATDGGTRPAVDMYYQTHMYDRYNWDNGKFVNFGKIEITDNMMGSLHTAGLAKEFNQFGTSSTKHYKGALPMRGSSIHEGTESRQGDRSDPTRVVPSI